ncbi:uncharacterized protein LOC114468192 isoform X2 [Gouania willdenowi]|uniref:uncharacterized protein LOC114468192 isoform X2 n=1 Tax=Gouania willdenowi TaxID=441366 RepID=UPI00105438BD|nr:uncharacterized protein LOC114468192 isoform X2 [Gouania willdenowi]
MSTAFSFQAQLCSVMEALSKAAVTEISKLVEIETKMLKIEITRGRNEIASLTEKLQLMEKLLYLSQRGPQGPGRQDQDQDVGPGPVVMVQDLPQRATVEPDRMRPCVKSENLWSCRTLSTDVNSLHQGNEQDEPEEVTRSSVVEGLQMRYNLLKVFHTTVHSQMALCLIAPPRLSLNKDHTGLHSVHQHTLMRLQLQ